MEIAFVSLPYNVRAAMQLACLDLEGVLIPEIWINFAEKTGIEKLRETTREVPDYDVLMRQRLRLLEENNLGIADIQAVIAELTPLEGAYDFLNRLKEHFQVVILSDTFYEFAAPLMKQLDYPTLFCHKLEISDDGKVLNYLLRQPDQKRKSVQAFHQLNFKVIAAGDSYNDTTMLSEADAGILFRPPDNVIAEFPQFPVTREYDELLAAFLEAQSGIGVEQS
ncbi:MAG: phosphoserine/homoserine phosphotransferase [Verrucomicrobiales bacterium]